MTAAARERLISCDSHVLYTHAWVSPRLPASLRDRYVAGSNRFSEER